MFICEYGCDQEAKNQLKNGKWCCSKSQNSCLGVRKKMSEVKIGKERLDLRGDNSPTKRHEVRKKISEGNTGKYRSKEVKDRISGTVRIYRNLPEIKEKYSELMREALNRPEVKEKISGPNHYNWNPNREEIFTPYTELFSSLKYRNQIKQEQNNRDPVIDRKLTYRSCLHHIDYNKQNDKRENLIWLNRGTHTKTNYNREQWKVFLSKLNENIISGTI